MARPPGVSGRDYRGFLALSGRGGGPGIRHLEAALAMNERIGARSWLAHTYDDYAHMLLRRGKPNDVGEARRFLHSARAAYQKLGITPSVDPLYQPHLN